MAITQPISSQPVTEVRRTARASIEVPRAGPQEFVIYREKILLDAEDNVVFVEPSQLGVRRRFDLIAEESTTLDDGTVLTGMQVIEALAKQFDRWADEDAANAQPAFVPPPPMPVPPPPPPPPIAF